MDIHRLLRELVIAVNVRTHVKKSISTQGATKMDNPALDHAEVFVNP